MKRIFFLLALVPLFGKAQFVAQGIATQAGNAFILNGVSQSPYAGRIFYTQPFNLNNNFDLTFNTLLGHQYNNGFAFLFINGSAPTTTNPPVISNTDNIQNFGTGSIGTDFVVEFDIRGSFCGAGQNTAYEPTQDINHISYWKNNSACAFGNYYSPYSASTQADYYGYYPCRIKWTKSTNTLETYYNNTLIKSNVIDLVGLMSTTVYWGFSSGCYCVPGGPSVQNIVLNGAVVLPLTLTDFTASKNSKVVTLNWQTSMEQNTSYFDIEKSNDGNSFSVFKRVEAAGFSNVIKNYSAIDNAPFYGTSYYRLQSVDKDGRINYSGKVAVTMYDKDGSVNIFPNPVVNDLQLQIPSDKKQMATITIEDAAGKTIQQKIISLENSTLYTSINTTELKAGVYLLVVDKAGIKEVKKFIKQ